MLKLIKSKNNEVLDEKVLLDDSDRPTLEAAKAAGVSALLGLGILNVLYVLYLCVKRECKKALKKSKKKRLKAQRKAGKKKNIKKKKK